MSRIAVLSEDKQDNLLNLHGGGSLRIRSHAKFIFPDSELLVFSQNAKINKTIDNIKFCTGKLTDALILQEKINAAILFTCSKINSDTYRFVQSNHKIKTIVDLYNPLLFEKLSYTQSPYRLNEVMCVINSIIKAGDYYICASEKQKTLYLGWLAALAIINKIEDDSIPIAVIPTNLDFQNQTPAKKMIKTKDFVFFGGMYPWFDTSLTINFCRKVIRNNKNMTFIGLSNPQTKGIYLESANTIRKELKSYENKQIYYEDWMPYNKTLTYLSRFRSAVNFVKNTIEDEFAYRTRFLSLLKSNVPIITNGNDEISKAIVREGAGLYLDYKFPISIEKIIKKTELSEKKCHQLYQRLSQVDQDQKLRIERFVRQDFQKRKPKDLKEKLHRFISTMRKIINS